MPELRFAFFTLDCVDIDGVAAFWAALLEGTAGEPMDDGRFVFIRDPAAPRPFCLQRVSEPKASKNRMHLDFEVDDLDATTARIVDLGGGGGRGGGGTGAERRGGGGAPPGD